ncbi:MAG: O-antigen ligase family protein [Sphingomonadaceae bacterium]|nr:O-antigen ligase family protein [Sphingomonadaceae bacterium]
MRILQKKTKRPPARPAGIRAVLDLAFFGFLGALLVLGFKRPFLWVLGYIYVDILTPQKISWGFLQSVPVSFLFFLAAFGGWLLMDSKRGTRFTLRQFLMLLLLALCAYTTTVADFPVEAAAKWSWVWKSLFFGIFLPFTLRTRLRIEAATLIIVLSAGSILISSGIKTVLSGGGYGTLSSYVNENSGIYEGSTLSTVAITIIPLIVWLARHGTIFPPDWRVKAFAICLGLACLLTPVGTQTRTGLLCIGVLAVLALRDAKRRLLLVGLMGAIAVMAIPFLPQSYTERMGTIRTHEADTSASTRVAVWMETLNYVRANPMGGGFDAYLGNEIRYKTRDVTTGGDTTTVEYSDVVDKGRAYHSAYFEVLGEQGWLGLFLWFSLHGLGVLQLELIRWRLRKSEDETDRANASLANALQMSHIIYLVGSLFIGIAYQPFVFMLVGLQIGLVLLVKRRSAPQLDPRSVRQKPQLQPVGLAGQA